MATRVRESALGKGKKGTTSTPLHDKPTQQTRSLSLSRSKDPNGKHDPPPLEKHVSNHLKQTLSSTPGASKNPIKKQISIEASKRPHLTRTTSSDKAPLLPFLHTPKAPNPNHPLRSSSLSAKTSAALKPVVDKSLKSPGGGEKPRSLYARSLSTSKKSGTSSKNHVVGNIESTKKEHDLGPPERVITPDIPEVEKVNDEPEEVTINAVESHKDEELVEDPRTLENKDKSSEMQKMNETNANANANASLTDSLKVVAEEKEGEESKSSEKREEVTTIDERERVDPEGAKEYEVVNEVKQEAESSASQVKKNSTVSNDVIEETASKLREQRKNKVKALAGAFETVITLQDPK